MAIIVQISDPHVSPLRPFFNDNLSAALAAAEAMRPDAIIVTGDLTINGADEAADLALARDMAQARGVPVYAIPGNHDIGEEPGAIELGQPVTPERRARWTAIIGSDSHAFSAGGWRIIAINSQLFGTGLEAEGLQWEWLLGEVSRAAGQPVAVFLHKPLFITDPAERTDGLLSVPSASRNRLLGLARAHNIRLFASGHLHQSLVRTLDGIGHVWAPSCGFPVSTRHHPEAQLSPGLTVIRLGSEGQWAAEHVIPPGLAVIDYTNILAAGPYASLRDVPPAPRA